MTLTCQHKNRLLFLTSLVFVLLGMFSPAVFAAAKISIKGIGAELQDNVAVFLNSVSGPRNGSLEKYREQLRNSAAEALQAVGYYEPTITVTVQKQGKDPSVDVWIVAGQPVRFSQVALELRGEAQQDGPFQRLIAEQKLKKGAIFHHGDYEDFKTVFSNLALSRGYFDAKWQQSRVEVYVNEQRADATLSFDSGSRYRFGQISISGAPQLEELILSTRTFKTGDYYLAETTAKYNGDLADSNYFRSILVRPLLEERADGVVPIAIQALPKADNIVSVGGGYATDVGLRGKLKWTIPRINRAGHSVLTRMEISTPEQNISASYKIPIENPTDNFASVQLGYQRKDNEDTESSKYALQVRRQKKLASEWVRSLYLRYETEKFRQGQQRDYTSLLLPGISFARDRIEGGLNVHWGNGYQVYLEVSDPVWGSDVSLAKIQGQAKWVRTAGENREHKLILRADLGAILVENVFQVPASLRFFTGGDQTIRGFSYESISPRDAQGLLIGGRYLTVGSVEYGYLVLDDWRLAGFVDFGTATNDFSEPISIGAGPGLRWITPVGPIRLDLAFAVSEPGKPWMVHFSMGPDI